MEPTATTSETRPRGRRGPLLAASVGAVLVLVTVGGISLAGAKVSSVTFPLAPNPKFLSCVSVPGSTPVVKATVTRGGSNDTLSLKVRHVAPNLAFDMFTAQNSNLLSDGTANPAFTNFGLAWYQSDVQADANGSADVTIKTILLDQIFGFDPAVALGPTNTFHVGIWFNNPADAAPCGFTGTTPFNGEHNAGPVAFITKPNKKTNLGPLCTDPNTSTTPATCNP
jgi:hypothetical protein